MLPDLGYQFSVFGCCFRLKSPSPMLPYRRFAFFRAVNVAGKLRSICLPATALSSSEDEVDFDDPS